jgi:hypothetical protein
MTTADRSRRLPVIEVLYVQDCPHYQHTLALVDRVRGELGIDTLAGQPEERWVREALLRAAGPG